MTRYIVHEPLGHYGKWNTAGHRRTKTVKKKKKKDQKTTTTKKTPCIRGGGKQRNEHRISVMHNDKFWTPVLHMSISLTIL